jgi:O-antigen/teichoic acid export membrane protein
MVIVLIPCLFHLTQTIAEEIVYAQNKVRYRAFVYVIAATLSVSTIVLLSPKYGAIGAAIGVCLSFVVAHNIIMDIFYCKILKINMICFFKGCHVKILPAFLFSGAMGFLMQEYMPTISFALFIVKAGIWAIIYFISIWFMAFNNEEKNIVKRAVKFL